MLEQIKKAMRISHNALDSDIQSNISSALADLARVGVNVEVDDELISKAVELYCKWQYEYLGKAEQYQKNYELLRDSLSLSGDYHV